MKNSLIYGSLLALAAFLLVLVLFICGLHSDASRLGLAQGIGSVGGLAIGITFLILGIRARRRAVPAGEGFSYGQAFGAGFGVQLVASLLGIVTTYLYAAVINPNFTEVLLQA